MWIFWSSGYETEGKETLQRKIELERDFLF